MKESFATLIQITTITKTVVAFYNTGNFIINGTAVFQWKKMNNSLDLKL